jgi:hypothetical protein
LLDFDDDAPSSNVAGVTGGIGLLDLLGDGGSAPSTGGLSHKFAQMHPEKFAPKQTVNFPQDAGSLSVSHCNNASDWKKMLPFNMKEGSIYEAPEVNITAKFDYIKFFARVVIEFKPSAKGDVTDVFTKLNPVAGLEM